MLPFLEFTSLAPLVAIFVILGVYFIILIPEKNRHSTDGWTSKLRRFVISDWLFLHFNFEILILNQASEGRDENEDFSHQK